MATIRILYFKFLTAPQAGTVLLHKRPKVASLRSDDYHWIAKEILSLSLSECPAASALREHYINCMQQPWTSIKKVSDSTNTSNCPHKFQPSRMVPWGFKTSAHDIIRNILHHTLKLKMLLAKLNHSSICYKLAASSYGVFSLGKNKTIL